MYLWAHHVCYWSCTLLIVILVIFEDPQDASNVPIKKRFVRTMKVRCEFRGIQRIALTLAWPAHVFGWLLRLACWNNRSVINDSRPVSHGSRFPTAYTCIHECFTLCSWCEDVRRTMDPSGFRPNIHPFAPSACECYWHGRSVLTMFLVIKIVSNKNFTHLALADCG